MSTKQTLVVIGNGMVGQNFLASLVTSPVKDDYEIVTFCEEPRAAYDRVHLSAFFSGKTAEDLSLVEPMPIRLSQVDRNFLDSCTVIPMHQTMPKGKPVTTG
jgi:hypothetical protein